jgi:hypothetical protein
MMPIGRLSAPKAKAIGPFEASHMLLASRVEAVGHVVSSN